MLTYSIIAHDGRSYGPVSDAGLVGWVNEGRVVPQTIVLCHETGQRQAAQMIPSISGAFRPGQSYAPTPPMAPAYAAPMYVAPMQQPMLNYALPNNAGALMMYQANMKSVGVAYLLWFFLGQFGAHRFYLGKSGSGAAILILTLVSIPLLFVVIGIFTLIVMGIWVLVDAFLIPEMARQYNIALANQMGSSPYGYMR